MQAQDVMTARVVSVSEDAPVHEVLTELMKHRISAVPVVDEAQNVVGIVSEGDLLRPEADDRPHKERPSWLQAVFARGKVAFDKTDGRTAGSVMTRDVVTVDVDTPLNEIARLLETHRIKRVPVLCDGKLAGIVSRANLLHGLANAIIEHHEPGAAKNRELRQAIQKSLLDRRELDTVLINVTVNDGAVRLWGVIESEEEKAAAEGAVKAVPGVKSLENNLWLGPPSGIPI